MFVEGPSFITRPLWLRLGLALGLVLCAILLAHGLWLVVDRPISSPLFLAVMILSAWLCGFRISVLTAILSGMAIKYFFVLPYNELIGDRQDMVRIAVFVIEGILLAWLIQKVRIASDRIKSSREELRALTEHQRTLRELEQKRVSREIHDELGQALTSLKMKIHLLVRRIRDRSAGAVSPGELEDKLADLSELVDGTITSVRRISSELRPSILDDFGLVAAIEWQASQFEQEMEIPCLLRSSTDKLELDSETEVAMFRIIQEALTNIARHAAATKVSITLRSLPDHLLIRVEDNGRGIDLRKDNKKQSLGILGMKERSRLIGAALSIGPRRGGGTTVELKIPIDAKDTSDHDKSPVGRRSYDRSTGVKAAAQS
jgi:signal transduction histidine kinase